MNSILSNWQCLRSYKTHKYPGELSLSPFTRCFVQSRTKFSKCIYWNREVENFIWIGKTAHCALESLVCTSVTACGIRGGRNGVWIGFSQGSSRFLLPQISFHHFSILISFHPFLWWCVRRGRSEFCYSQILNKGASSYLIPRSGPVYELRTLF